VKGVELYGRVRYAVRIEGLSEQAAARRFGLDPRTVNKMMKFSVPPGYVRKKAPAKRKLDPFIPMIDSILRDDKFGTNTVSRWPHDREGLCCGLAAAVSTRVRPL
jgi:hypothetical protein